MSYLAWLKTPAQLFWASGTALDQVIEDYYGTSNESSVHVPGDSLGRWMLLWLSLKVTWDPALKVSKWGVWGDAIIS